MDPGGVGANSSVEKRFTITLEAHYSRLSFYADSKYFISLDTNCGLLIQICEISAQKARKRGLGIVRLDAYQVANVFRLWNMYRCVAFEKLYRMGETRENVHSSFKDKKMNVYS